MDGNGNKERIIVTPYRNDKGQVKWELEIVGKGKGGPGNYPELVIPQKQSATKIEVEIKNTSGFAYKFVKDSGALWVSAGSQDPSGPSTYPDQIPPDKIKTKSQDSKLEFVDLNQGAKIDLHYTLVFVDQNNQQSTTLDPIIRNGGGGGPGIEMTQWAIAGGAILGAVLLVVLLRRTLAKRRQQPG